MSGQRPWWASDGPVDGGVARDEDPVERFRAARRGASGAAATGGSADADAASWLEVAAATMSRLARDLAQGASPADADPGADPDPGAGDGPAVAGSHGGPEPDGEDEPSRPPHTPEICGICPICVGLRSLAEARPELLGHLAEVARHASLAVRSLTERPEHPERGGDVGRPEQRGDVGRPEHRGDTDPLEHIDLD